MTTSTSHVNTELPDAVALADNTANPTAPAVGAFIMGFDGATWDRVRLGQLDPGALSVELLGVDPAIVFPIGDGTFPVEITSSGADNVANTVNQLYTAGFAYVFDGSTWDRLRGDSTGGAFVQGPAAIDAASAGNPLLLGGRASLATPTAISTDGDAQAVWLDRRGALKVVLVDDAGNTTMDGANDAVRVNVVAGSGAGVTHTDKGAFTPSTDDGVPVFGMMDDASPSTLSEGEAGVGRMTANRALHVNLRDASGTELSVGGGTQYDEDTAHASGDKVTMAGVVQQTSDAALAADGDRTIPQVDSTGYLKTRPPAPRTASGSLTALDQAVTVSILHTESVVYFRTTGTFTASYKIEATVDGSTWFDARFLQVQGTGIPPEDWSIQGTAETAAGRFVVPVTGFTQVRLRCSAFTSGSIDVTAATGQDASYGTIVGLNSDGHVDVGGYDGGGVARRFRTDTSGRMEVSLTGAGTTVDTELPTAIAPGDTDANPTAPEVVSRNSVWNGTQWVRARSLLGDGVAAGGAPDVVPFMWNGSTYDRQRGDTTNGLDVDVTRLPALVAGTANIGDVDIASVAAGTVIEVIGDVAHDVAAPANPVVTGGQMETMADSAPGTRAGTDGDATKFASVDGAQFVITTGPQIFSFHDHEAAGSLNTDTSVHAAPGAGLSLYVTDIVFSIGAATASSIFFEEGATTVLGPYFLEAVNGRGMAIHFVTPKKITANTALTVTNTGATTFSIETLGFIAPG